jgi:mRNA degradation ribonuclease J1/J2
MHIPPKAKNLDDRLKLELESMLQDGYNLAPISRPALQKRLGLKSSGTLAISYRAQLIETARTAQLQAAGLDSNGKKKRNTIQDQNKLLQVKIHTLEQEKSAFVEKLSLIINGSQARGLDWEEIMLPIRYSPNSQ